MAARDTVLLDCRWLSIGGAGRVSELLLRGLSEAPPAGRWVLWGPTSTRALAWPGAEVVITKTDPRAMLGQRSALSIPGADLAMLLHQMRPLRPVPSVTWVYDTIPLRFSATSVGRSSRRWFLRRVVAISRRIITTTEWAKASICRDLGVADDDKVVVVPLPFDDAFSVKVKDLRQRLPTHETAVFVGRFAAHKNLPRLVSAFGRTELRRRGGRLVLVGGTADEVSAFVGRLTSAERSYVEVRPMCSQDELERLFATARLAVQPSLEEGFGLPAWEALSCALPVCVSDGGALPEITRGLVEPFPARSVEAMAEAMDSCAERARACPDHAIQLSDQLRQRAPTVARFARAVRQIVEAELGT